MTTPTLISSSSKNPILDKVRRWELDHEEVIEILEYMKRYDEPRRKAINSKTRRNKLMQALFSIGPVRLAPHPLENSWVFKGGNWIGREGYVAKLEAYAADAELVLRRLAQLKDSSAH